MVIYRIIHDRITTTADDYRDVDVQDGDVLYADIPYEGTDNSAYGEGGKFNYDAFSRWANSLDVPVYVSSVKAPKGFTEIWSKEVNNGANGKRTERLFVQDKFADPEKKRLQDSNQGQVARVEGLDTQDGVKFSPRIFDRTIPTLKDAIDSIKRLFDRSLHRTGKLERQIIAGMSNRLQKDLAQGGLSVDAAWVHSIDDSQIGHAMKEHGNDAVERGRGQIAISKNDFEKIPEILDSYDDVEVSSNKNKQGNQVVVYSTLAFDI